MQDDCGTVNIDTTRRRKETRKNKKSVGKVINCHQVCHANLSEAVFMFYESLWYTELEVVCMWPDLHYKTTRVLTRRHTIRWLCGHSHWFTHVILQTRARPRGGPGLGPHGLTNTLELLYLARTMEIFTQLNTYGYIFIFARRHGHGHTAHRSGFKSMYQTEVVLVSSIPIFFCKRLT